MKKNNKKAFTLAELLCVLTIIGIVTTFALTTMQPQRKALKYQYMGAYNSLAKAYYNGMLLGYTPFSDEAGADGVTPVHTNEKDTGTEQICRALTSYINTVDNDKGHGTDYSPSCSATKLTSELADSFTDDKVQFIATNGTKFYITKRLGDGALSFYIVFVDINGERKPNSFDKIEEKNDDGVVTRSTDADIYPFVLLDGGRIIPIGTAEYDKSLLTARIAYYEDDGSTSYTNKSLAYYQAKGLAWGFYNTGNNPLLYNESEPFTMNDVVRAKINAESKIVKGFPSLSSLSPMSVGTADYKCSADDTESCYVFLDEYTPY